MALWIFDSFHQNGDGFGSRGQWGRRKASAPGGFLTGGQLGLGGEIHIMAVLLFTLDPRILMKLPEKGARIHVEALAQLRGGKADRGLAHQSHDRLGQMAMTGETDLAEKPEAVIVEERQFWQGVVSVVVVETGQGFPLLETAAHGAHGSVEFCDQFRKSDHLLSAPAAEQ